MCSECQKGDAERKKTQNILFLHEAQRAFFLNHTKDCKRVVITQAWHFKAVSV